MGNEVPSVAASGVWVHIRIQTALSCCAVPDRPCGQRLSVSAQGEIAKKPLSSLSQGDLEQVGGPSFRWSKYKVNSVQSV